MIDPLSSAKLIIQGTTLEGRTFRPSDWAERLSGNLCTFRNRRIYYSPLLRPIIVDGVKSIVVDLQLQILHPGLFDEVMQFAQANRLSVVEHQPLANACLPEKKPR